MGAGADTSRRRTAELLRGAASGRGVAPNCNTVLPPGRVIARRKGECWSIGVLEFLLSEEKRIATLIPDY